MIPIDTIVSIKSGDEYGGKYTGKLGILYRRTAKRQNHYAYRNV